MKETSPWWADLQALLQPYWAQLNEMFGDAAPFVVGGAVAVLLVVLVLVFRKRGESAAPDNRKPSEAERDAKLAKLEKEQRKQADRRAKEEEELQKQRQTVKLGKAEEREKELQAELARKQEELRRRQTLTQDLPSVPEAPEPEPEAVPATAPEAEAAPEEPESLLERFRKGIQKTRTQLFDRLTEVVQGRKEIDEDVLDDLEEVLLSADIGPETSQRILDGITEKVEREELKDPEALLSVIQEEIRTILGKHPDAPDPASRKPWVTLMVGVNGVGKTTTIGKLAAQHASAGRKVLLGAGDTFRAAAIEQLGEWSQRSGCDLVAKEAGSDPSAVMYEAVEKAIQEEYDVVICDTAGRLHTKKNLMEELKKMVRVIRKQIPDAPHEVLLVLDATTGQNAIFQAREFREAADLTGLVVTKLDGTAKGGVVIGIVNEFDIPVRYIGIGERIDDLRPFDAEQFAESLLN
ncbi:MAG: signal recognition particle-docking protein FtsY [SAR324 cluster bacterium]|nr:signal recognition particle-docking protein FtsY [SAR324 cluster bacterium]